jgi:hypothetical protein
MRRFVNPVPRRATPLLRVLPALALAACASGGASTSSAPVETTRTVVTSSSPTTSDIELVKDTRLAVHRTTATPDKVWATLPAALADLGLSGGPQTGQTRTYLASVASIRRQLNKVPLSRYLECGTTPSGASGADTHLIRLQVTSIVEPDAQGARVRTQVLARATSIEGSAGMIDCSTTGVLEARLGELLEARLRNP